MRTLSLTMLVSAAMITACGGPKPKTTPRPLPNVVAAVAAARNQPQAQITWAVFSPEAVPARPDKAARSARLKVAQAFRAPPAPLQAAIARAGTPLDLRISVVEASELPLNPEALAAAAGPFADAVAQAGSVWLLRYQGPARDKDAQVFGAAVAAAVLAEAPGRVVLDLQTLTAFDHPGFVTDLQRADWLADQVKVEAVRDDAGAVMFLTRGMARFALPDLEMAGVPAAAARAHFKAFQQAVNAARLGGPAWLETTEGEALTDCSRPAEAWDLTCRGVPLAQ